MKNQKGRTFQEYELSGARIRLAKAAVKNAFLYNYSVMNAYERSRLMHALSIIQEVSGHVESRLFQDFPHVSTDIVDVYNGDLNLKPRNQIDADVKQLARTEADRLFGEETTDSPVVHGV